MTNTGNTFLFKCFAKEKFASHVFNILASQYSQTYFVGGAVRNVLLHKKITDIDIATSAKPEQVAKILTQNKVKVDKTHARFGVVIASKGSEKIEVTTFRKDSYAGSRFPKITFTKSAKTDSNRRDFTINALYYNPMSGELLDFHNGLKDLQNKRLKFIGVARVRVVEDPLRIARAHRFALEYQLKFDSQTKQALDKEINLIKKVSKTRLQKEINALTSKKLREQLKKVIHNNS